MTSFFEPVDNGLRLYIRLSPRSKRTGTEGFFDDGVRQRLKIAVNAPPVDGKANKAVIELLAEKFRLPKSAFSIVAGTTERNKTIFIAGDTAFLTTLVRTEETDHA